MERLLEFKEVAEYLHVDPDTLIELLRSGELMGFEINNQWRVREADLLAFLNEKIEAQRLKSIRETLSNPTKWIRTIKAEHPKWYEELKKGDFAEGTLGAWLKQAILKEEA